MPLQDIKRVIVNTHAMDPQQLIEYFGTLSSEWALECLKVRQSCWTRNCSLCTWTCNSLMTLSQCSEHTMQPECLMRLGVSQG